MILLYVAWTQQSDIRIPIMSIPVSILMQHSISRDSLHVCFLQTLLYFYVFAFCLAHIMIMKDAEQTTLLKDMSKAPAYIALIVYTSHISMVCRLPFIFHFYLISTNQVTKSFRM